MMCTLVSRNVVFQFKIFNKQYRYIKENKEKKIKMGWGKAMNRQLTFTYEVQPQR